MRTSMPAKPTRRPNVTTNAKNETIQTLDPTPAGMLVQDEDQMVNPGEMQLADGTEKEPAVDREEIAQNPGPPVRRYRVVRGGRVQTQRNGQRTLVNTGKVLDENNFDISLMREQGVELEELASA